jgi:hypothetical protein
LKKGDLGPGDLDLAAVERDAEGAAVERRFRDQQRHVFLGVAAQRLGLGLGRLALPRGAGEGFRQRRQLGERAEALIGADDRQHLVAPPHGEGQIVDGFAEKRQLLRRAVQAGEGGRFLGHVAHPDEVERRVDRRDALAGDLEHPAVGHVADAALEAFAIGREGGERQLHGRAVGGVEISGEIAEFPRPGLGRNAGMDADGRAVDQTKADIAEAGERRAQDRVPPAQAHDVALSPPEQYQGGAEGYDHGDGRAEQDKTGHP